MLQHPLLWVFLREEETYEIRPKLGTHFSTDRPHIVLRLIVMLVGVAVVSASVALTRATGLGTSPVSCFPATLSYLTPLTIGTWTFVMNVIFVLIQIAPAAPRFNPYNCYRFPYVFVFSALIDVFVPLCELIPWGTTRCKSPGASLAQLHDGGIRCIPAGEEQKLSYPSGEGINLAISRVTRIAFPKVKVAFDCTNVAVAAAVSLACSGALYGVAKAPSWQRWRWVAS